MVLQIELIMKLLSVERVAVDVIDSSFLLMMMMMLLLIDTKTDSRDLILITYSTRHDQIETDALESLDGSSPPHDVHDYT